MFLCLFTCLFVFPTCFMLYAMFSHAYSSFCSVLMFGSTCSNAWYHVYGYALLRSTCFYAPMPMSMPSHACMLGFVFFHVFMLSSTCLDVHLHAYMHISMLICVDQCVYMLRLMFSTCFMPSSMCLCASCYVYVPRPWPCLSCHVLL